VASKAVPYGPIPGSVEELCAHGTNGHSLRAIGKKLGLSPAGVVWKLNQGKALGRVRLAKQLARRKQRRHEHAAEDAKALAAAARTVADNETAETFEILASAERLMAIYHERQAQAAALLEASMLTKEAVVKPAERLTPVNAKP